MDLLFSFTTLFGLLCLIRGNDGASVSTGSFSGSSANENDKTSGASDYKDTTTQAGQETGITEEPTQATVTVDTPWRWDTPTGQDFGVTEMDQGETGQEPEQGTGGRGQEPDQETGTQGQETGTQGQETGGTSQGTGATGQETGGTSQGTGARGQETGGTSQGTGATGQETGGTSQGTGATGQETGFNTHQDPGQSAHGHDTGAPAQDPPVQERPEIAHYDEELDIQKEAEEKKKIELGKQQATNATIFAGTFKGITEMPNYERERNVQINDLPERPEEDMVAIIERLSYLLQISIHPHDIQAIYRVRAPPGRIRPIMIEFHDRVLRNRILMASRRAHLSADDFYQDEVSKPVYINEPLSRYHKKLLYETKRRAMERGYKYVWFRNSEVKVRKMEDAEPISIKTFEDLESKII